MTEPNHWISRIQKGDVLRFPGNVLRVVRDVKHWPNNSNHAFVSTCCTFSIRRCSWTHRPTTTYSDVDLNALGVRPTRAKVKLRKKIDKAIEQDLFGRKHIGTDGQIHGYPLMGAARQIDCCDVRGIL